MSQDDFNDLDDFDLDDFDDLDPNFPITSLLRMLYKQGKPLAKYYSNEANKKKLIKYLNDKIRYAPSDASRRVYKKILDRINNN